MCKSEISEVNINGEVIQRSRCIKYLDADLDTRLSLKDRKCRIAVGNLHKLKCIWKGLTLGAAKTIAIRFVISHLGYANVLYSGLPNTEVSKLQRIQNITAKTITGARKYDSSTEVPKTLHWLPIHTAGIEFKVLTPVFGIMLGLAPHYLCDLIDVTRPTRSGLRSGNIENTLIVPFIKYRTVAGRTFSVFGPKAWNNLPDDLRSATDYKRFKRELKTYMFQRY